MKHEDLRTPEQKFDDFLAEDLSFTDIAFRLGWSNWKVKTHYRKVCAEMGEQPDEE